MATQLSSETKFKIIIKKESKDILSNIDLVTLKTELDDLLSKKSLSELNKVYPNLKLLHQVVTKLQKNT